MLAKNVEYLCSLMCPVVQHLLSADDAGLLEVSSDETGASILSNLCSENIIFLFTYRWSYFPGNCSTKQKHIVLTYRGADKSLARTN